MQDRKGIQRIVRRRRQHPAVVDLQNCRIAIAGERLLIEVVDDQRSPGNARRRRPRRFRRDGRPSAVVRRNLGEEPRVIGLLAAFDAVVADRPISVADRQVGRFAISDRLDIKLLQDTHIESSNVRSG